MKLSSAFHNFSDVNLALTGFGIFGFFFVATVVWVFWIQSERHFQRMSEMPINDEV